MTTVVLVLLTGELNVDATVVVSVITGGIVFPLSRSLLLQRGVFRPADCDTPRNVQLAELVLVLAHVFRISFVLLAPVAIATVLTDDLPTIGDHLAYSIGSILSGFLLWAALIWASSYFVIIAREDLEIHYNRDVKSGG